ncbi:MAG: helix-turn-helix transcriptional regulator, partial [Elainellaceae cyanobacterium]
SMGKAGKALKTVLADYGISQNQLALALDVSPVNVSRWANENRDPPAESAVEIKNALEKLDPAAAEAFVMLYMYDDRP